MRFIKVFGPEATPDDWMLWCLFWGCSGMLAGGVAVLGYLAWGAP